MHEAPSIEHNWGLFLDLDGTLIDIASTPDRVAVPPGLVATLVELREALDGALAIVSGRPFSDIDRLLAPVKFIGGAEHGAFMRDASGITRKIAQTPGVPDAWRRELASAIRRWDGVTLEDKSQSVALHYRAAPKHEEDVRRLAATLVERHPGQYEMLPAKMALEIRPRGVAKGDVVMRLMTQPPFAGRVPVYVGDDVTDEDGLRTARILGGIGLHVGETFRGAPARVRAWLAGGLASPQARAV